MTLNEIILHLKDKCLVVGVFFIVWENRCSKFKNYLTKRQMDNVLQFLTRTFSREFAQRKEFVEFEREKEGERDIR